MPDTLEHFRAKVAEVRTHDPEAADGLEARRQRLAEWSDADGEEVYVEFVRFVAHELDPETLTQEVAL